MANIRSFMVLATAFFLVATYGRSQEIRATVSVSTEQIPISQRDDIQTMKQDVENYLNHQRYTGKDWPGEPISVDITIYLMGRSGNTYQAKLFIVSKRALNGGGNSAAFRSLDDQWEFPYARNASFNYQPLRFDPFSSLLDYYMFLIIGMDMDTYGEADGTPMFEAARQIVQLGANNNGPGYKLISEPGDFTRYNLISELTDLRFDSFRKMIFSYYVDGMDVLATDRQKGLLAIDKAMGDMVLFKNELGRKSIFLQTFFDAKYQELIDLFKGYGNKDIFRKLKYLDPTHTSHYERAEEG